VDIEESLEAETLLVIISGRIQLRRISFLTFRTFLAPEILNQPSGS